MDNLKVILLGVAILTTIALVSACVTGGQVNALMLDSPTIIGGQDVQGQVALTVQPGNERCQGMPCPIRLESSNPSVAQIDAEIIFANQQGNALFQVHTQPVPISTTVELTAYFLLCESGTIPPSTSHCARTEAESGRVQLQVVPEVNPLSFEFSCDSPFESPIAAKPPLRRELLKTPPGFETLPLNSNRVIGFTFAEADHALIVQPVQAFCKFENPNLGSPMGVVWLLNENAEVIETYVVAIQLDSADGNVAKGVLINSKGEVQAISFLTIQMVRSEGASEPLFIDVTIRANGVCFRVEKVNYCSNETHAPQLAVRKQFEPVYKQNVIVQVENAITQLVDKGLLDSNIPVDISSAISAIEDKERIKRCLPGEPTSCHADMIVAATKPNELPAPGERVDIGVLVVVKEINFSEGDADLKKLSAGYYVVSAEVNEQGRVMPPVQVRGVLSEGGQNIEGQIPAKPAPYISEDPKGDIGVVEISGIVLCGICIPPECWW